MAITISVELSGGLELLFGRVKSFPRVALAPPPGGPPTMRDALRHIRAELLRERPELFLAGDTVRPGILVLINDCDWELEGQLDAALAEGDRVCFISTLHGG